MEIYQYINNIKTKEEFMEFIKILQKDSYYNLQQWENKDISEYLEGIYSWVEDMDGYYKNMKIKKPEHIDWNFIATLLYIGKIYE